jgi:hypothetical protein
LSIFATLVPAPTIQILADVTRALGLLFAIYVARGQITAIIHRLLATTEKHAPSNDFRQRNAAPLFR